MCFFYLSQPKKRYRNIWSSATYLFDVQCHAHVPCVWEGFAAKAAAWCHPSAVLAGELWGSAPLDQLSWLKPAVFSYSLKSIQNPSILPSSTPTSSCTQGQGWLTYLGSSAGASPSCHVNSSPHVNWELFTWGRKFVWEETWENPHRENMTTPHSRAPGDPGNPAQKLG